jgi:hypothetical protein
MRRRRRGIVRPPPCTETSTGQIAKRSATRFDCFAYASSFVRRRIVDRDDIVELERRPQTLFGVGQKLGSIIDPSIVHGAFMHCGEARPQR